MVNKRVYGRRQRCRLGKESRNYCWEPLMALRRPRVVESSRSCAGVKIGPRSRPRCDASWYLRTIINLETDTRVLSMRRVGERGGEQRWSPEPTRQTRTGAHTTAHTRQRPQATASRKKKKKGVPVEELHQRCAELLRLDRDHKGLLEVLQTPRPEGNLPQSRGAMM